MALALSLLFDSKTSKAVERIWKALANAGLSSDMLELGYPPHLTLLIVDDESQRDTLELALPVIAQDAPRRLRLGPATLFSQTDVVYIACEGDLSPLFELQASVSALVPENAIRPYYRPGSWTPHLTLETIGDAERSMRLATDRWTPGREADITALELVTVPPIRSVGVITIG